MGKKGESEREMEPQSIYKVFKHKGQVFLVNLRKN